MSRVTVYDVIFGELWSLNSYTTELFELYQKPNLGELAVNGRSPNCKVAMIWRVTLFFFTRTSKFCLRLAVLNFFSFLRLECS